MTNLEKQIKKVRDYKQGIVCIITREEICHCECPCGEDERSEREVVFHEALKYCLDELTMLNNNPSHRPPYFIDRLIQETEQIINAQKK